MKVKCVFCGGDSEEVESRTFIASNATEPYGICDVCLVICLELVVRKAREKGETNG